MSSQPILTVSYTLSPPQQTNAPPLLTSNTTHTFEIEAEKTAKSDEYYEALHNVIIAAKEKLGEELTAWRDAVGSAEVGREKATKAARAEDEEEEEEKEEKED